MAYFNICSNCGCNLDPGEKCDCKSEKAQKKEFYSINIKANPSTGQFSFLLEEEEAGYAEKSVL